MTPKQTLILTKSDIVKIFNMRDALAVAEQTFRSFGKGKVQMPEKTYLFINRHRGDFRAMPAYLEDLGAAGVKWVNVHTENYKKGLPTVMAIAILADARTGFPLAVMDGTYLTNLRTGAAGGIAAKYLARKNSHIAALIGSGNQAHTQLAALRLLFKIKQVNVWSSDPKSLKRFISSHRARGLVIKPCKTAQICVENADIVVTTTPSRRPVVKWSWLQPGTHINAIGADAKGKEELEPVILRRSKLVIDDWIQSSHGGEINVPVSKGIITRRDVDALLGDIVCGKKKGRTNSSEITVFDSTGLSIQDIASAHYIYKQALKRRVGKFISFF